MLSSNTETALEIWVSLLSFPLCFMDEETNPEKVIDYAGSHRFLVPSPDFLG